MRLKYSKQHNIIFCPQYCAYPSESIGLVEVIKQRLVAKHLGFQINGTDLKKISAFHEEKLRTFHFPALECVGENPQIAILGITKGNTQLEHSLKILAHHLPAGNVSSDELADIINDTCIHSVFAGNQIRSNISKIFNKIGLWKLIDIEYNSKSPERHVNKIIGESCKPPHKYFYIASFVKCAMLTQGGKSDAPSFEEIAQNNSASRCIENNLFPPFEFYENLRTVITFGKTSFNLVHNLKIKGKTIIEHFNEMDIKPIYLPHPSGANVSNIKKYLNDEIKFNWVTPSHKAEEILTVQLNK